MDTKVPAGAITSLNGMRVLSMWWVILGHTFGWMAISGVVSEYKVQKVYVRYGKIWTSHSLPAILDKKFRLERE